MLDLWLRMTVPGYAQPVTRDQLGHLGGNPRFSPPPPDRLSEIQHGHIPTTEHSAIEPWWYRI